MMTLSNFNVLFVFVILFKGKQYLLFYYFSTFIDYFYFKVNGDKA